MFDLLCKLPFCLLCFIKRVLPTHFLTFKVLLDFPTNTTFQLPSFPSSNISWDYITLSLNIWALAVRDDTN